MLTQGKSPGGDRKFVRRYLAMLAPALVVIAIVALFLNYLGDRSNLETAKSLEVNQVELEHDSIRQDFNLIVSDLLYLARDLTLQSFLSTGSPADRAALGEQFLRFSAAKRVYDQVRYIDASGAEVVRINATPQGPPQLVPDSSLQRKADRYYVAAGLALEPGKVFVSPFDLNVENDQVERPLKPTIRFATPAVDRAGKKSGIVVLNFLGETLLKELQQTSINSLGRVKLLNPDGFFLYSGVPGDAWGFQLPERADRRFDRMFPDAWERVANESSGQFQTASGLFTFRTVHPLTETHAPTSATAETVDSPAGYHWKLVSWVPTSELDQASIDRRRIVGVFAFLSGLGAAIGLWFLARAQVARAEARAELAANEKRFRELANNVDDVLWTATPDRRRMTYLSPAFERIWGRPVAAAIQSPDEWLAAILPEDRQAVENAFFTRRNGGGFDIHYRIVRPDGGVRTIWDRGFVVTGPDGEPERMVGIADDTTALREAQDLALLSERLAAIGEAMTGLAHESRNALQRSQACLDMLAKRLKDRPELAELLIRAQTAQDDLYSLYEEVRGYAAPVQLRKKLVETRPFLESTWQHVAEAHAGRTPAFSLEIQAPSHWRLDPAAIERAVRNALENACGAAGPDGAVTLSADLADGWLRLAIRDTGNGLNAEQRARIFEPFFTTKARGTGLGMAIARRLVEAHGGRIGIGNPPSGAEIIITLPPSEVP